MEYWICIVWSIASTQSTLSPSLLWWSGIRKVDDAIPSLHWSLDDGITEGHLISLALVPSLPCVVSVEQVALFLVGLIWCRIWLCLILQSIARNFTRSNFALGDSIWVVLISLRIALSIISILDSQDFRPLHPSRNLLSKPLKGFTTSNCSWGGVLALLAK